MTTPASTRKEPGPFAKLLGGIIAIAFLYFVVHVFIAPAEMKSVENDVAADQVKQYRMVEEHGTAMQRCVQAQMVSQAYLQAKDDANYAAWEKTRRSDCSRAGLPEN